MPINIQDISDQDVQNLLTALDAGDPKQKATVNALLAAIAAMSGTIDRLDRQNYLSQAALTSVGNTLGAACALDKLRSMFGAPDRNVDMQAAIQRITTLADQMRQQTDAAQTFATVAKMAIGVAKVFI